MDYNATAVWRRCDEVWEAASSRIVTARLKWVGRRQRRRDGSRETSEVFLCVMSAYAPTTQAAHGVKVKLAMNYKMLLTKFLQVTSWWCWVTSMLGWES